MGASNSQHIQDLEQSFQVFNQVSERLETTYQQLEDKVSQLHGELTSSSLKKQFFDDSLGVVSKDNEKLRAILTALPAGVVVLDGSGRIQECNPA